MLPQKLSKEFHTKEHRDIIQREDKNRTKNKDNGQNSQKNNRYISSLKSFAWKTVEFPLLRFIRHHHPVPSIDPKQYRLCVDGVGTKSVTLCLEDLKSRFLKREANGERHGAETSGEHAQIICEDHKRWILS